MTEFERQVQRNRERAEVQRLNNELQKAEELPLIVQNLNNPEQEHSDAEDKRS